MMTVPEFDLLKGRRMKDNSMTMLVAAVMAVAVLCTLLAKGGWLIWVPVLLALAVVGYLAASTRR